MSTLELLVVEDDLARSFELDGIATIAEETYKHGLRAKLPNGSETTVGWISRHKPRPPVEAELFS
jgi:hypothetical protein